MFIASSATMAAERMAFAAIFSGSFSVGAGPGASHLFKIEESGAGEADGFGAFTFFSSLVNNDEVLPDGCFEGSSIGVDGWAVLSFADGDMYLRRARGEACIAFPVVYVTEEWRVSGGTGRYRGAQGKLTKTLEGIIGPFTFDDATLEGFVRLK